MNIFNFFKKETNPTTNSITNLHLSLIARLLVTKYKEIDSNLRLDPFIHDNSPVKMTDDDKNKYKQMLFDAFSEGSTNEERRKFYAFEKELIKKYYPPKIEFIIDEGIDFNKFINNLSKTDYDVFISYIKMNKISDNYWFDKFEKDEFGYYSITYKLN